MLARSLLLKVSEESYFVQALFIQLYSLVDIRMVILNSF